MLECNVGLLVPLSAGLQDRGALGSRCRHALLPEYRGGCNATALVAKSPTSGPLPNWRCSAQMVSTRAILERWMRSCCLSSAGETSPMLVPLLHWPIKLLGVSHRMVGIRLVPRDDLT